MTVARVGAILGRSRQRHEVGLDPLIKEARDRQWRRRRRFAIMLVLIAAVAVGVDREWQPGSGGGSGALPVISSQSIGGASFGEPESQAVAQLTRVFGPPTGRFINTGCSPRFKEVAWQHLYVEFRSGKLSGFRYILDGWPPRTYGTHPIARAQPRLAVANGITLGATLGQLRHTYGRLRFVGTDRWQGSDGLIFYDNAQHDPEPASSRIVEIKFGTCGDY
jgi:hypothetical protein